MVCTAWAIILLSLCILSVCSGVLLVWFFTYSRCGLETVISTRGCIGMVLGGIMDTWYSSSMYGNIGFLAKNVGLPTNRPLSC